MDIVKQLAAPLRSYFNPRFEAVVALVRSRSDALQQQLDELVRQNANTEAGHRLVVARYETLVRALADDSPGRLSRLGPIGLAGLLGEHADGTELERQAQLMSRIDVSGHHSGPRPTFDRLVSQAAAAADFRHPAFRYWAELVHPYELYMVAPFKHRKLWEWVYILEAVRQSGGLREGATALGFGVGNEPVPALLASHGIRVLATDQDITTSGQWAETGQHLGSLHDLRRPQIVSDDELARLVGVRAVDMNDPLDDLGSYDIVWSSCALEHLGSPAAGLDFVLRAARLLKPGGVSVHTTELELTVRTESAEYGNCAVYRREELLAAAQRLRDEGFEVDVNPMVSLDTPEERWVSQALARSDGHDISHLRLQIGESISTSFGLLVRRPD